MASVLNLFPATEDAESELSLGSAGAPARLMNRLDWSKTLHLNVK